MTNVDPNAALWRDAQSAFLADPARAQALCELLLARAPHFWGAHWMLSRLFQAQRRFRAAVAHARASARSLGPGSTPHEILLVSSGLISTGEYEVAHRLLELLDPAIRFDPMQLNGVVEQWMMLDDPRSALRWLDIAKQARITHPVLSLLHGNALHFLGRMGEAEAAYEDAILLESRNPHAYLALASLCIEAGRAGRIARLEQVIARGGNDDASLAVLHFALFKELDQAGDADRAWPHLARAMSIRKATSRYDSAVDDAIFDHVIEAQAPLPAAETARVPLFIVGLPRSGTTLVERILGNHPDVANCGELSELRMAYKWASDYSCEAFLDLPAAKRLASTDAALVGERYLASTRWRAGDRRWHTDKHPGNLVLAKLALAALPGARILHVHKQPMDACFGCLRESFAPGYYDYSYAFADMANHHANQSRLARHLHDVAPDRVLGVQYEDLVSDPAGCAQSLLAFCGLSPMGGVQDITANRQPVTTASSAQVRQPIHAGRVGYWRRYERHLLPLQALLESA